MKNNRPARAADSVILDSRFSIFDSAEGCAKSKIENPKSKIWLWVVAACVLQVAVWFAWITIASRHRVAEVPLAPAVR